MKGMYVRQPFAEAIADGHKTTENRGPGFSTERHRGLLAIGAPARWHPAGWQHPGLLAAYGPETEQGWALRERRPISRTSGRPPEPFEASVILAVADLADVHDACVTEQTNGAGEVIARHLTCGCDPAWAEYEYEGTDGELVTEVTHLVLARAFRLPYPVPTVGSLGIRELAPTVAEAVAEQMNGWR